LGDLIKGLVGIALALTIIGVASMLLSEAIPFIFALGVALVALGAGFALIGAGAFLIGKAIESIANAGKKAAEAIPVMVRLLVRQSHSSQRL
jgi:hypothetical protein